MKRLALLIVFIVGASACGSSDPGPPPPSAFRARWFIDNEFGDPISCSQVPADTVTFTFVGRTTGDRPDPYIYNCDQGLGLTVTSPQDLLGDETYDLDVTLWFDYDFASRQDLGTVSFVVITSSTLVDIPDILFQLVP